MLLFLTEQIGFYQMLFIFLLDSIKTVANNMNNIMNE